MTLSEIIVQLKSCDYRCEAGPLTMNVAFQELEIRAQLEEIESLMPEHLPECGTQYRGCSPGCKFQEYYQEA